MMVCVWVKILLILQWKKDLYTMMLWQCLTEGTVCLVGCTALVSYNIMCFPCILKVQYWHHLTKDPFCHMFGVSPRCNVENCKGVSYDFLSRLSFFLPLFYESQIYEMWRTIICISTYVVIRAKGAKNKCVAGFITFV